MKESPDKIGTPDIVETAENSDSWKDESYRSNIVPPELPPEVQAKAEAQAGAGPQPVSAGAKLALGVLAVALAAGILGDALLRETPWGINVLVWAAVATGAVVVLVRRQRQQRVGEGKWLLIPVICFAAGFAWRDSVTLQVLDALALLLALVLIALRARTGKMLLAGFADYLESTLLVAVHLPAGLLVLLFGDIHWRELPRDGWAKHAPAVGRGLAIAAPLIFLFGALFVAADAVFENVVSRTFNLDAERLFVHLFLTAFITFVTGGFLRYTLLAEAPAVTANSRPQFLSLGIIEIGIVLSLLNLLFLAFVAIQFRYFFGGAAHVMATTGLTYSEYARRGFFELVTVALLVLPLLLMMHWLLRKEDPAHERLFRVLAGIKLLLLFVIMASAVQRMRIYQLEFGMTELRLYTTAFMGWLAVVFVWFGLTVLRGQRARFAFGAVVSGFAMVAVLHAINPDAMIVRTNAARSRLGMGFDVNYATSLSADAVPSLLAALPDLKPEERRRVLERLGQKIPQYSSGWRSWNWSRARAKAVTTQLLGQINKSQAPAG
ncbi:MAG TPA: DUF4173 domain-containing protein [Blastocatellia bacterium]|nr:DUF4173 domain-containing protein [Blastocatellia bacterium]